MDMCIAPYEIVIDGINGKAYVLCAKNGCLWEARIDYTEACGSTFGGELRLDYEAIGRLYDAHECEWKKAGPAPVRYRKVYR